jgi:hypothetical protein
LIWGRAAALLGRSGLALFDLEELLLEIYVDDPHSVIQGVREARTRRLAVLLLWW